MRSVARVQNGSDCSGRPCAGASVRKVAMLSMHAWLYSVLISDWLMELHKLDLGDYVKTEILSTVLVCLQT